MGWELRRRAGRLLSNWTVRSIAIGGVASVIDVCVLLLCARSLELPPPLAAACGVTTGAAANFLLNRRFAFQRHGHPVAGPAVRFALGTALLVAAHAGVVSLLTTELAAPLLVAKYSADFTVLLGGNLLLLRYVVFPRVELAPEPSTG